jgi:hypothetical protein
MMPTYYVNLDDESTYPEYRWDEEIVRTEVFPIFDNRVHTQEQSSGLLEHTRIKIITEYTAKPGTSVNPYSGNLLGSLQGPMTLEQHSAFNAALRDRRPASYYHSNRVGSTVKSSSPNGPKKMKEKKKTSFMSCPPGFRYDFKTKSCVKIKGRKRYATKKKFRNYKRR